MFGLTEVNPNKNRTLFSLITRAYAGGVAITCVCVHVCVCVQVGWCWGDDLTCVRTGMRAYACAWGGKV